MINKFLKSKKPVMAEEIKEVSPRLVYYNILRMDKIKTLSVIMSIILVIFSIMIILVLAMFAKTDIKYVEFSKHNERNYVKIIPKIPLGDDKRFLIRQMLTDYVRDRVTIDRVTDVRRIEKVLAMSTSKVNESFRKSSERIYQEAEFERRYAEIISDHRINDNLHRITFKTIDIVKDQENPVENIWTVLIGYQINKYKVQLGKELLNPIGLIVTSYSQEAETISENRDLKKYLKIN